MYMKVLFRMNIFFFFSNQYTFNTQKNKCALYNRECYVHKSDGGIKVKTIQIVAHILCLLISEM